MTTRDEVRAPRETADQPIGSVPLYTRKRIVAPAICALAAAVCGVLYWYVNASRTVFTDDAYVDADRVTVSTKYAGRISQLFVDEGSAVKKGQLLVRIDDTDLRAQQAQADAALAFAERSQELARINMERADEDFRRAELQFRGSIIPKEQFDHAKKALEAARAQNGIALAQIATAKAQAGIVRAQLADTAVTAPMDGVVAKRWALPGDVVQVSQPILTVYDTEHPWVTANLEETKFGHLKTGQTVEIAVDTYGSRRFEGTIIQLGSNTASQFSLIPPNNASGNFTKVTQRIPVKIALPKGAAAFLPGMSAVIRVRTR